jgi:ADP-ribosylglycohydrolase
VSDSESRFSLVAGEGDGAILGLAAGDSAGGAWELGYSAITEQATVISYLLIESPDLDTDQLLRAIRELDGADDEEPVYRAETPHFRTWLTRAAAGGLVPEEEPSLDAAPRGVPVGVALRRDPVALRTAVVEVGRVFHSDLSSIVSGVVTASAAAASCFGQSGRDLIAGVVETVELTATQVGSTLKYTGTATWDDLIADLRLLMDHVGVTEATDALAIVDAEAVPEPWDLTRVGLLLAAPLAERAHIPIEQAARVGGSSLGAVVGGIIGARVGIRAWPWAFANDTWFAEIGRRLVRGPNEVTDLPIPYAVEQHLISGERGFR